VPSPAGGNFADALKLPLKAKFWRAAMTEMVPRKDKSDPLARWTVLAIAVAGALFAPSAAGSGYDGPTLRRGLWKFERTLETDGKPTDKLETNGLPIDRQMTRCADPTEALRAEFTPLKVAACDIKDIQKTDDGYAFQRICRGTTPIKTAINIKSDSAYTQINEGNIGKISTTEIVVARRVGDCHPPT
jgi:hypothetical protein